MDDIVLDLKNANKYFPGVHAVKDVSLSIIRGEIHGIIGENGAGKSTLTKMLTGVYAMDTGELLINGEGVKRYNTHLAKNLGIGRVPQELELIDQYTVMQNILISDVPRKMGGLINWKDMKKSAEDILRNMEIEIDVTARTSDLSTGYQQMVAIAKALISNPQIIVFDEPTSSLSDKEVSLLMDQLRLLKSKGVTILYISHKLGEVKEITDRITVMRDGSKIVTVTTDEVEIPNLISHMIGRDLSDLYPKKNIKKGKTILKVENLNANKTINANFELKEGEILGLYGLVGSGRTEMVRALFGADSKESGDIYLHHDVKKIKIRYPGDAIKNGIVLLPENRRTQGIISDFSVKENISLSNIKDYCVSLFIKDNSEKKSVKEKIKMLNIQPPNMNQKAQHLSGGNQQKVVVGKCISGAPGVLIFDEPTKGIDVGAKVEIYKIMERLASEKKGVIFISSEMTELIGVSDRILVFREGEITRELDRNEFTEESILHAAMTK